MAPTWIHFCSVDMPNKSPYRQAVVVGENVYLFGQDGDTGEIQIAAMDFKTLKCTKFEITNGEIPTELDISTANFYSVGENIIFTLSLYSESGENKCLLLKLNTNTSELEVLELNNPDELFIFAECVSKDKLYIFYSNSFKEPAILTVDLKTFKQKFVECTKSSLVSRCVLAKAVVYNNDIYCFDIEDGNLYIFNLQDREWRKAPNYIDHFVDHMDICRSVVINGELVAFKMLCQLNEPHCADIFDFKTTQWRKSNFPRLYDESYSRYFVFAGKIAKFKNYNKKQEKEAPDDDGLEIHILV
ncbi:hypothetical protein CHUAL_004083 [Chamberlinius hualienensis]